MKSIPVRKVLPLLLMALCMLYVSPIRAQNVRTAAGIDPPAFQRTAQTGFQFLHLPTTARSAAMAGIHMASGDASAAFNNPANLVGIDNLDLAVSHISYIADIQYNTGAIVKNMGLWGVVGVRVASLDAGEMVRTENVLDDVANTTSRSADLGTFTAGNLLVGVTYARSITDRLAVGGNVSYIREKLAETEVNNLSIDFGVYFETGFRSLRLALVAKNIGPDAEYVGFTEVFGIPQSVRMPIDFRFAMAYDFLGGEATPGQSRLTGYLEGVHPNDGPERVHAAVEYEVLGMFAARGGYRMNYDEQGLTAGAGVNFSTIGFNGRFDYAYVDYGRLSYTHILTLGIGI